MDWDKLCRRSSSVELDVQFHFPFDSDSDSASYPPNESVAQTMQGRLPRELVTAEGQDMRVGHCLSLLRIPDLGFWSVARQPCLALLGLGGDPSIEPSILLPFWIVSDEDGVASSIEPSMLT